MTEMTVLELSQHTGLSRSKIYYLIKKGKLIISNGKINSNIAIKVITELSIKKIKVKDEIYFRQFLNMLNFQNDLLQKQLDLALEREKAYLAELTSYRQHILSKITKNESMHESDVQVEQESNGVNTHENSQKPIQSGGENKTPIEPCQSINKETKTANEAESHPITTESICNEMTLPEVESGDTGLIRSEKEMTEQNDDAPIVRPLPNQDDIKPPLKLNRQKKSSVTVSKGAPAKYIDLVANTNKRKPRTGHPVTDKDDLNKEDHHNYKQ